MERIGNTSLHSFFDGSVGIVEAKNQPIRKGPGHHVGSYLELAKKVAEIQFMNRDHVLLFRGQPKDYKSNTKGASLLKATLFRLEGKNLPNDHVLKERFEVLRLAEKGLLQGYSEAGLQGIGRVRRHRIIRWAILQHYDVCRTPLFDVSQSLRVAASFAMLDNETEEAFVFAFGVPNLSGAITASSESGLQIVRLSSACPPEAVRPHLQEGYLLSEYPEVSEFEDENTYDYHELDFGRRLIAKFKFNPYDFRDGGRFVPLDKMDLFPSAPDDSISKICSRLKRSLKTGSD